MGSVLSLDSVAESPLAAALSLVVLACWGVLLVTRGRFRRAIAVLALVAALGLVAATVEAFFNLPDALADSLLEVSGVDTASTSLTAWYAVALVAALASVGRVAGRRPARRLVARDGHEVRRPGGRAGGRRRGGRRAADGEHRHLEGPRRGTRPDRLDFRAALAPLMHAVDEGAPTMAAGHGNTPAAWTAVGVAMLGFVVGSIALLQTPAQMTAAVDRHHHRRRRVPAVPRAVQARLQHLRALSPRPPRLVRTAGHRSRRGWCRVRG